MRCCAYRFLHQVFQVKNSMKASVPMEIKINERDIYQEGWECRSTYDSLVTDALKLIAALNLNKTVPLINAND